MIWTRRGRSSLFNDEKPKLTLDNLCSYFITKLKRKIHKSTLSKIIGDSKKYDAISRIRQSNYPELDQCLYWFTEMSAHNLPISGSILLDQAKDFLPELAISHSDLSAQMVSYKTGKNVLV